MASYIVRSWPLEDPAPGIGPGQLDSGGPPTIEATLPPGGWHQASPAPWERPGFYQAGIATAPLPAVKGWRPWRMLATALATLLLAMAALGVMGYLTGADPAAVGQALVPSPAPAAAPVAPAPAAAHVTRTTTRVVFRLSGDAPTGVANVSYGPVGGQLAPAAGVPFRASLAWAPHTAYVISAQLYGPGSITATITVRKVTRYSDGTRKVTRTVVATGATAADGSYAIARWAST